MTRRLEGKSLAAELLAAARASVAAGIAAGHPQPLLASVHRGGPTPFAVYLRRQAATASEAGIGFREVALEPEVNREGLRHRLIELDRDPTVHAILVEHPLPEELDFLGAISALQPEKDVDGVSPANLGLLVSGRPVHVPAVAVGALALARHHAVPLDGVRAAVVGRSATVGLPLALLLLARGAGANATVTVAHSKTHSLAKALVGSEVIFTCAGKPGLLDRSNVPQDAAVVDVGLTTVPDPSRPSGSRIVGDANSDSLEGWVSALAPVPGGVGPVTVAQLMTNVVAGWTRLSGGRSG